MGSQPKEFSIMQYNTRRSYDIMSVFLRNPPILTYDVIAIQEPWINEYGEGFRTHNPAGPHFHALLPPTSDQERPRVAFLVNKRINKASLRFTCANGDLCSLHVQVSVAGRNEERTIHNVYNPHVDERGVIADGRFEGVAHSSHLPELDNTLQKYIRNAQIALGDFNLYHEQWNVGAHQSGNKYQRDGGEMLQEIMEFHGMKLALEAGTVTRPSTQGGTGSMLDLVWT